MLYPIKQEKTKHKFKLSIVLYYYVMLYILQPQLYNILMELNRIQIPADLINQYFSYNTTQGMK